MATLAPSPSRCSRSALAEPIAGRATTKNRVPISGYTGLQGGSRSPHIALIGNHSPQRCGIATFTADTIAALTRHKDHPRVDSYILDDDIVIHDADKFTRLVRRDCLSDYKSAAAAIDRSGADIAWVQHEFGIFGGSDGMYICDLVEQLDVPVAVTLHTILKEPSAGQDAVMRRLIDATELFIVMAEYGREVLRTCYGVGNDRIAVIPHGIPDFAYHDPETAKPLLNLSGRKTVLTFGLLSPDKGIDRMIEAMPSIVERHPDALYIVLGATHPHLKAQEGEALRDRLQARAAALNVADSIRWIDRFVETDELVEYLRAADIYVTPYLNPMQITSGTLSYAVGLGKPVVSTPYIHASELLTNGTGVLVPFRSAPALAVEIGNLLDDDVRRIAMAHTAYKRGRSMVWSEYANVVLQRIDPFVSRRRAGRHVASLPQLA